MIHKTIIRINNSILFALLLLVLTFHMVVTGIDAWNTMRTNYQNDVLILQTKELERDAAQSKVEEIKVKQKELECLARNIYWEAANESYEGKLAVAQVTLNRTKASGYPNTVCEVVYQKMELPDGNVTCQFSWTCDANTATREINPYTWEEAHYIAKKVLTKGVAHVKMASDNVLFYHADYVQPGWTNLVKYTIIGHHIFYRKA